MRLSRPPSALSRLVSAKAPSKGSRNGANGVHAPWEDVRTALLILILSEIALGYDFVELHAAHGYLLHSFLSREWNSISRTALPAPTRANRPCAYRFASAGPSALSNQRTDAYGGSPENRARLLIDISKRIHSKFPSKSLWVRVSSTDYAETSGKESWDISGTTKLAPLLEDAGVDVLDCSAGGLVPFQKIDLGPAYQLPYAAAVKELGLKKMLVASVGMLEGEQGRVAEKALQEGKADLVLLARGFMNSPSVSSSVLPRA